MLKLKKGHKPSQLLVMLGVVFAVAWGVWTFFLLPASNRPAAPNPMEPGTAAVPSAAPVR